MAIVSVRDTGRGMRKEDLARLFQPFTRVSERADEVGKGHGLGLYICKGIVDLHAGQIWAESPGPSMGSTFTFSLPGADARKLLHGAQPGITQRSWPPAGMPPSAQPPRSGSSPSLGPGRR
jgi:K+-sensing histidine kinase KdpD